MKNINEYMKNYIDESRYELPEIGKLAIVDGDDNDWYIDCYCNADGSEPQGVDSLQELLKSFDFDDSITNEIKHNIDIDKYSIIVGVHNNDDERDMRCFVWGNESGRLYYEK